MALQLVQGLIYWPGLTTQGTGAKVSGNGTTLDAAGEYVAFVIKAREAMTISHIWHRVAATATGSPTLDVRIETVSDTTGLPTGTLWATNTNLVTGALAANTEYTHALTASASINAGETFAIKLLYNSGTAITPFNIGQVSVPLASQGLPYVVTNTGSPTKGGWSFIYNVCPGSSSTAFYKVPGLWGFTSMAVQSFSTSNGDAFGNRFQVPFTCRCTGLSISRTADGGNFSYGLYDDAGTELSSSSTAHDNDQTFTGAGVPGHFFFVNPVTLSAATWYRAAIWPSSTTNVGTYKITQSADLSETMRYTNFHYTTKATGGAWTDSAVNEALTVDLIIDQLDDGVSAGGGGAAGIVGLHGINNGVLA
jgi:hypothetical protein